MPHGGKQTSKLATVCARSHGKEDETASSYRYCVRFPLGNVKTGVKGTEMILIHR